MAVVDCSDGCAARAGAVLKPPAATDGERLIDHPTHFGLNRLADVRHDGAFGGYEHVAACDIDGGGQLNDHSVTVVGAVHRLASTVQCLDDGAIAGRLDGDLVAHRETATVDHACVATEVGELAALRTDHALHMQAATNLGARVGIEIFEPLQQRRTVVPRCVRRCIDHVVAQQRRQWDCGDRHRSWQRLHVFDDLFGDEVELCFVPIDEVHLVDSNHD